MSLEVRYPSLLAALEARARDEDRLDNAAAIYLVADDESESRLSYAEIFHAARNLADAVRFAGVGLGDPVPVVIGTDASFFGAMYGLMMAGAVPVPMALPIAIGAVDSFGKRLRNTCEYLKVRHAIVAGAVAEQVQRVVPDIAVLDADRLYADARSASHLPEPAFSPDATDIAFLQCTSGSTGTPKGVMLAHENLLANVEQLYRRVDLNPSRDVFVSWLPLHHDMGLIAGAFLPMYAGIDNILLAPQQFQRRPAMWLRAISRHRGTLSPAPNFAYGYVAARAKDRELEGVDLSSWRFAWCGAEQIDFRTREIFQKRFAGWKLPSRAFRPCYGLAEASLCVTCVEEDEPFVCDRLDRDALVREGRVLEAPADDPHATYIVAVGKPVDGTEVRIADDAGVDLPDGQVGRVLVRGPSVMRGYWGLPDESRRTLAEGWLDTGDLGYLRDGNLRITGRNKDIIIIRGRCYPPTDFEWAAQTVPGVRLGTAAAFGLYDPDAGTERLHLVVESDSPAEEHDALRRQVIAKVTEVAGLRPDYVHVVPRYTVPKTTSGKIRRNSLRQRIERGEAA